MGERLDRFLTMGRRMGYFGGGSGTSPEENMLDIQNKRLLGMSRVLDIEKKRRELMAPEDNLQEQKSIMGMLKEVLMDPSLSPATRENYEGLFTNHYFGLNEKQRAALAPLVAGTPVDPMHQKAMAFDKMYPRIPMPVVREGDSIFTPPEDDPKYQMMWADYKFKAADRKYLKAMTIHGKEVGDEIAKPPTFIPVGDKLAYRDEKSKQPYLTDLNMLKVDVERAKKWGWSVPRMVSEDFYPVSEPRMGTYRGQKIEVTPGRKLSTGEFLPNMETYGNVDESIPPLPDPLRQAVAIAASDVKLDEVNNREVRVIAEKFREVSERKHRSNEEIESTLAELTDYVNILFPGRNLQVVFPGEMTKGWWSGAYYMEGMPFALIQGFSPIDFSTPEGRIFTLFQNPDGTTVDEKGVEVPEAQGAEQGSILEVELEPISLTAGAG